MSNYFSNKYDELTPYTPGEQPQDKKYLKLNTNESPFPPSPIAQRLAREKVGDLFLYSDPDVKALVKVAAERFNINEDEILFSNGSDEILNFAFMAYCDDKTPAAFADITYGFYEVFAKQVGVPFYKIPLKEDFTIDINDYKGINKTIFIANPNAPTGVTLSKKEIEEIVKANPNNVVVIDEAYIDFGGESCMELTKVYNNLLVCQTFSKSRSLAGARLGFAVGNKDLIQDLKTIKYSVNPYNVNSVTMMAGIGALLDENYFNINCNLIIESREYFVSKLKALGFTVLPSCANFVFAKSGTLSGENVYLKLKNRGILVRYFNKERLKDYVRISIGTKEQMDVLLKALEEIL